MSPRLDPGRGHTYARGLAEGNEQVVLAFLDSVFNQHDLAAVPTYVSNETLARVLPYLLGAFPDLAVEPELVVSEDEWVAVRFRFSGTHQGEFRGAQPTGRPFTATASVFYRIADGKIADFRPNWDWFDAFLESGALVFAEP